jgi:Tfp pilus assembly protein PilV
MTGTADGVTVPRRLRSDESGFGLIELVLAMVLLSIAVLALIAAFSSGALTLQRAGRVATATALGEGQMERYRALRYDAIGLVAPASPDTVYTSNQPVTGTLHTIACAAPAPPECQASQTVTGPDGRSYRIDSYVMRVAVSGTHDYKRIRVIVRDAAEPARAFFQTESTFDQSTGL